VRQRSGPHLRAERCERRRGVPHRAVDLGIEFVEEVLGRHEHAQAASAGVEPGQVVVHRHIGGGRVGIVVSGEHGERDREVAHRARERSSVIERPRKRDRAAQAHTSVGRLQAGDTAERRWDADRPAGVAARG
jgi:hypothetical protein